MKRITAVILTALLLAGCSAKGEVQPDIGDIAVTEAPVQEFRELTAEDFAPVNVNLNALSSVGNLQSTWGDLGTLSMPDVQSPCLADGTWETLLAGRRDDLGEFTEEEQKMLENPQGRNGSTSIKCQYVEGETMYFAADYDWFCRKLWLGNSHCLSVGRCSIYGGEAEEICRIPAEEPFNIRDIRSFGGAVWLICSDIEDDQKLFVKRIDPATGKLSDSLGDVTHSQFMESPDRLAVRTEDGVAEYTSGSWQIIAPNCEGNCFLTDSGVVRSETGGGSCIVYTDDFRLDTGIDGILRAAGDTMLTVYKVSAKRIWVFDLERMERYEFDLTRLFTSDAYSVKGDGDDLVICGTAPGSCTYLMPRQGYYMSMFPVEMRPGSSGIYLEGSGGAYWQLEQSISEDNEDGTPIINYELYTTSKTDNWHY